MKRIKALLLTVCMLTSVPVFAGVMEMPGATSTQTVDPFVLIQVASIALH